MDGNFDNSANEEVLAIDLAGIASELDATVAFLLGDIPILGWAI